MQTTIRYVYLFYFLSAWDLRLEGRGKSELRKKTGKSRSTSWKCIRSKAGDGPKEDPVVKKKELINRLERLSRMSMSIHRVDWKLKIGYNFIRCYEQERVNLCMSPAFLLHLSPLLPPIFSLSSPFPAQFGITHLSPRNSDYPEWDADNQVGNQQRSNRRKRYSWIKLYA